MTSVAAFDQMPADEAADLLLACCGARRWVEGMVARRPFHLLGVLLGNADEVWSTMSPADWREAFEHHPRLGEARSAAPQGDRGQTWSSGEQAGLSDASLELRTKLAAVNEAYEARFGFICIICATGLSVADVITLTEERLGNDLADELPIAAEEQRKITRLRLLKLFHEPDKPGTA
jgi:OHCU decarboxylase